MNIIMPNKLDFNSSIRFCNELNINEDAEEIIYDYKNMSGKLEPFGMLLVGSKIREIFREYSSINQLDENYEDKMYAANMGYFKSVKLDFGKSCYSSKGSNSFIRIKGENIKESYNIAMQQGYGTDIVRYIEENIAEQISTVLAQGNSELKSVLKFCIVEVVRNIYDHSKSDELWYSAQFWPSKDLVEIAILDEGEGIYNSLKNNKRILANSVEDALKLAIQPGISKNSATLLSREINGNSGFGLYMVSSLMNRIGYFELKSGAGKVVISKEKEKELKSITKIAGTEVLVVIDNRIKINIPETLKEISILGSELAKNSNFAYYADKKTASQASTLID